MKRIYELVTEENQELSDSFVNEAFELLMQEESLDGYVTNFKIDRNIDSLGDYLPKERTIRINPSVVELATKPSYYNRNMQPIFYNRRMQIIHTLKHEMEHAKNLKRLYEGGHDIESSIIRFSMIDYIVDCGLSFDCFFPKKHEDYLSWRRKANYTYDPGERIADIRAGRYVVNLVKNQRRTDDLLFARILLYHAYIRGYKDNRYYLEPPTYTFLFNMDLFDELRTLKNTVEHTKYSLETRALLGLPITYEERDKDLLEKVRLQRRQR